jgi:hypothetical protein
MVRTQVFPRSFDGSGSYGSSGRSTFTGQETLLVHEELTVHSKSRCFGSKEVLHVGRDSESCVAPDWLVNSDRQTM